VAGNGLVAINNASTPHRARHNPAVMSVLLRSDIENRGLPTHGINRLPHLSLQIGRSRDIFLAGESLLAS
jgi:hypothetical protein